MKKMKRPTKMRKNVNALVGLRLTSSTSAIQMPALSTASLASWDLKCHRGNLPLRLQRFLTILPRHHHHSMPKLLRDRRQQRLG